MQHELPPLLLAEFSTSAYIGGPAVLEARACNVDWWVLSHLFRGRQQVVEGGTFASVFRGDAPGGAHRFAGSALRLGWYGCWSREKSL